VRVLVEQDVIVRADEADDGAEARGPPRREEEHVLRLDVLGDGPFESARQAGVPLEDGRGGGVRAVVGERADGRVVNRRVRGEAQVILRAEVDAFDRDARLIPDARLGRGRGFERACVRPRAEFDAPAEPVAEIPRALGEVRALRVREHAQVLGEGIGRDVFAQ
jgi:hypothetical protein